MAPCSSSIILLSSAAPGHTDLARPSDFVVPFALLDFAGMTLTRCLRGWRPASDGLDARCVMENSFRTGAPRKDRMTASIAAAKKLVGDSGPDSDAHAVFVPLRA